MEHDELYTEKFLKGLTNLTGLPYKKAYQYAKENSPFNILEHPNIMEPNWEQLEKIGLLKEFIASYNILKINESNEKLKLDKTNMAGKYFLALLGGMKDKERFMVSFLDNGNNIIETKIMSEGSIGQTYVYPREILKYSLACDCNAIILAHNHPGGSRLFSREDRELTQRIVDIFLPLEIKVLDHIVVYGSGYSSMAERGEIPQQCMGVANYEVVALGNIAVEEQKNTYEYIHSR